MILANGCSFTEGYNLPNKEDAWPFQLGKLLNQPVTNLALGAGSNDRIVRTLKESLSQSTPDVVIVGWTELVRNEISHHQGDYLRCHSGGCLSVSGAQFEDLSTCYEHWLIYNHNSWLNYRNWIYNVLFFQNYFKKLKIPFVFFSAFGNNYIQEFLDQTDASLELANQAYQGPNAGNFAPTRSNLQWQELLHLCQQIDLSHWALKNTTTMHGYLKNLNFATDRYGHYLPDGHAEWARVIARELQ